MPLEKLNRCPLCKSVHFLNHSQVKDHSISHEVFYLCKCADCGVVFTNPRPDEQSIGKYYDSPQYISHQNTSNSPIGLAYKLVRAYTVKSKVKLLNSYFPNKGSLLDYGCGTGHFLKEAKKNGWKTYGVEPNQLANQHASSKELKVYTSLGEIKKSKRFDAITLFHVLEHIHSLRKTTKNISKLIRPEGRLFVAVPNHESFDAKHYQDKWAAWDVPRHLYHFNESSIKNFADEFGFEIESFRKMPFDSYYVSLLSERYKSQTKTSLGSVLQAVSIATQSNLTARKDVTAYSSFLIVMKKK